MQLLKKAEFSVGKLLVCWIGLMLTGCYSVQQPSVSSQESRARFDHTQFRTTCIGCHVEKRPEGVVKGFDHNLGGGTGDCVECHTAKIGVSWALATFNHRDPVPQTCNGCHEGKPKKVVNKMDHQIPGLGDCVSCHDQHIGSSWLGATFNHELFPNTCISCHVSERPVGPSGGPVQFDHANNGLGDCVQCHKNPGGGWHGGTIDHSVRFTTCIECHASEVPHGVVEQMDHNYPGVAQDCSGCHLLKTGLVWNHGIYGHKPNPPTCLPCHQ